MIADGEYPSDEEIGPDGLPIEGSKTGTKSISQRSKMKVLSDKQRSEIEIIIEDKVTSMKKEALKKQAVRKTTSKFSISKKSSIDLDNDSRSKSGPRGLKFQPEATGKNLHANAFEAYRLQQEQMKKPKMGTKMVNVDKLSRFSKYDADQSDSGRYRKGTAPPIGEVRKFVKDMKNEQQML